MSFTISENAKILWLYFEEITQSTSISIPLSAEITKFNLANSDGGILDFPENHFSVIYVNFALNKMPMSNLYMLFFEAKRLLAKDSLFCIVNFTDGVGFFKKVQARFAAFKHKRRLLQVIHFVSPEDWKTIAEEKFNTQIPMELWVGQKIIL